MSKFSNLKENMHRFKTKNLTEQAVQQDDTVSPAVQNWLDKNSGRIPAEIVFMKDFKVGNDPNIDIAIGHTEMPNQAWQEFWNSALEQYRKNKDQKAFDNLMTTIKSPGVTIWPHNGGKSSPYKYVASGTRFLKLVKG